MILTSRSKILLDALASRPIIPIRSLSPLPPKLPLKQRIDIEQGLNGGEKTANKLRAKTHPNSAAISPGSIYRAAYSARFQYLKHIEHNVQHKQHNPPAQAAQPSSEKQHNPLTQAPKSSSTSSTILQHNSPAQSSSTSTSICAQHFA